MSTVFNLVRPRKTPHLATGTDQATPDDFSKEAKVQDVEGFSSDGESNLDPYHQNEKEVQANPNGITQGAQEGVQKAEAAALVWSKKTIFCIYAW